MDFFHVPYLNYLFFNKPLSAYISNFDITLVYSNCNSALLSVSLCYNSILSPLTAQNPCLDNNGGCEHHCENDNGVKVCSCRPGFRVSPFDPHRCVGKLS